MPSNERYSASPESWIMFAAIQNSNKKQWISRNRLLVNILVDQGISVDDFFALNAEERKRRFNLPDEEAEAINEIVRNKKEYIELSKKMEEEFVDIIPLCSDKYPQSLKSCLKMKSAPTVLFCMGNHDLLSQKSIAIVGSRKPGEKALNFTKKIAEEKSKEGYVVVSGFAQGIDKCAFESALQAKGSTIAVLAQGILSAKRDWENFKNNLNVLFVSTYNPKARWSSGLAMGRNKYIYALADDIFVAQSGTSGGTWKGAKESLEKDKKNVFVYAHPFQEVTPDTKDSFEAIKGLKDLGAKVIDDDCHVI